jgi:multidrug resistance efflux pump
LYLNFVEKKSQDMTKNNLIIIFSLLSMIFVTACSGISSEETPESEPAASAEEFAPIVSATGVVVPTDWARLSMSATGVVDEVFVSEDESVTAEQVKDGPNQGDVDLLEAQISKAQREYDIYRLGPDPDELAVAEARLTNAQAQLGAAQAALTDLELRAPFDGKVSEIFVPPSEWVNIGQPILLLADINHLQVETTDFSEIDLAQVKIGDNAIVTFDALPYVAVRGIVERIAPKAAEGAGVNYPITIELSEIPDQLRWGMTAFVDIEMGG